MRIVVIGSGQLGSQFEKDFADSDLTCLKYPQIDITRPADDDQIRSLEPEAIINCAAYTDVDKAEREPAIARAVNATGPGRLAKLAKDLGAVFVHVSTDFVFDGTSRTAYPEDSPTNPINVYGQTKLEGEQLVAAAGGHSLIIRTAWLNGGRGPNFILKMLELGRTRPELSVVTDQIGSPTFTFDLARAVMALLQQGQTGIFNVVNQGQASRFELVEELFRQASVPTTLKAAKTSDFPTPAKRPLYSVLSTQKLAAFYQMPAWQVGLARYVEEIRGEASD